MGGAQDLWEQGDLGSGFGALDPALHWDSAAGWGSALAECLGSFPSGNVWEKTGKSSLISQFPGVTLNLS